MSIQLFVRIIKNNTQIIEIHKDATIADLFCKLEDKTGMQPGSYSLIFGNTQIVHTDKDKHLAEFHLDNLASLCMVLKLKGGSKQLGDDVELSHEPDMISLGDGDDSKRAKMPCGHAIGPDSLTDYCRSELKKGKCRFLCPWMDPNRAGVNCSAEWPYNILRKVAVLSDAEKREFDTKLYENYMTQEANILECPGCRTYCERENIANCRVICSECSAPGRLFEFCWHCLKKWSASGTTNCGNAGCVTSVDSRIAIPANAPVKEILGVAGVPGRRACIKCGTIIEHTEACKHMKCTACEQEFCFICLKPKVNGAWQCGSYNSPCTVASRQTQLPGN